MTATTNTCPRDGRPVGFPCADECRCPTEDQTDMLELLEDK